MTTVLLTLRVVARALMWVALVLGVAGLGASLLLVTVNDPQGKTFAWVATMLLVVALLLSAVDRPRR